MKNKNILLSFMFLVFSLVMPILSVDTEVFDKQGKTSLIRLIIEKELEVVLHNKAIDQAFEACFGAVDSRYYYGYTIVDNHCVPIHFVTKKKLSKLASCTQEAIQALCQAELDLELFINATTEKIALMAQDGIDLNFQDNDGKTVLDYCSTQKFYIKLCNLGATKSTWKTWVHYNQDAAGMYAVAGLTTFVVCTVGAFFLISSLQSAQVQNPIKNDVVQVQNPIKEHAPQVQNPVKKYDTAASRRAGGSQHVHKPYRSSNSNASQQIYSRMSDCKANCK